MRPRGESGSSCHERYVGQAGKQKPQCTQSAKRSDMLRCSRATLQSPQEAAAVQATLRIEAFFETFHQEKRIRQLAEAIQQTAEGPCGHVEHHQIPTATLECGTRRQDAADEGSRFAGIARNVPSVG